MSFRYGKVTGLPFFDTLQSQKNINGKHAKILFNVFPMYEKIPRKRSCSGNKFSAKLQEIPQLS